MGSAYTKDEALWYAACQMRRAARVLDVEAALLDRKEYLVTVYGAGLDLCADECEKAMDARELERLRGETFPGRCPTCGRGGAAREANETGGVSVCYDPWHERTAEA